MKPHKSDSVPNDISAFFDNAIITRYIFIKEITMSNIKLFRLNEETWDGLECTNSKEKELQKFIEKNMKNFLGINFLKSENSTGKEYSGCIDSLGIDENYCPVIIAYKCSFNKNVLRQTFKYLEWPEENKYKFQTLVLDKDELDKKYARDIKWSETRVLCISSDFLPEIEEMAENESIELIRYKKYGDDTVLFEFVEPKEATKYDASTNDKSLKKPEKQPRKKSVNDESSEGPQEPTRKEFKEYRDDLLGGTDENLKDLYLGIENFIKNLGDHIRKRDTKQYRVFKRSKDFVHIRIVPRYQCFYLDLNLDPKKHHIEGITRDLSVKDKHHKTCLLQAEISSIDDFEQKKYLIIKSYEAS